MAHLVSMPYLFSSENNGDISTKGAFSRIYDAVLLKKGWLDERFMQINSQYELSCERITGRLVCKELVRKGLFHIGVVKN